MYEYLGVDIVSLPDQVKKSHKTASQVLSVREEHDCKAYTLQLQDKDNGSVLWRVTLDKSTEHVYVGSCSVVINLPKQKNLSYLLKFRDESDATNFKKLLGFLRSGHGLDIRRGCQFDQRTEESSAVQYFQFYGYLSQQQNMMQDYIRTSAYQRAILSNASDFTGKVVLDVGAGSGILSFFAAQAGARKVYAVEASSMAQHARTLVDQNHLTDRIKVIAGKIEEINLPEQVDVIISEPMGYMLYNERMLETYLHAKKWLKPNGKMYPTTGDLYVAPFTDEALYMEQVGKANFWYQQSFYGVDLTTLRGPALEEYFKQPIVDNFDVRICLSKPIKYSVNFLTANESDLHRIHIPLTYELTTTAIVHGLAFWFDVSFEGTNLQICLSTSPTQPLTHWYQVRCLLIKPLTVSRGQTLCGHATLHSNRKQSYDVEIYLEINGTSISTRNILDLKNPYFRYPSQPAQIPPGQHHQSPTEQYWNSLPTEQTILNTAHTQLNANSYFPNYNTNNSNGFINEYDANRMNSMVSNFQTGNYQQPTAPIVSASNRFDQLTAQMANGFISYPNSTIQSNHAETNNSSA